MKIVATGWDGKSPDIYPYVELDGKDKWCRVFYLGVVSHGTLQLRVRTPHKTTLYKTTPLKYRNIAKVLRKAQRHGW